jgi:phosphate starvation-inducible protein PhoH
MSNITKSHEIKAIGNTSLSNLAERFHDTKAALRVFSENTNIGLTVKVEERGAGKNKTYAFVTGIPVEDGTQDSQKLENLEQALLFLHNHFIGNDPEKPKDKKLNLDTARKALHEMSNPSASQGITSGFSDAATSEKTPAAPAKHTNHSLDRIVAKMNLTEFLEDGTLSFDPARQEVWTPTPGQRKFIDAFDAHPVHILSGPAGSGKTEFTIRMALGMIKKGETDKIIISAPVDEGGEEIGFRKGDDHEKMNGHISQILAAIDGHLGQGDFKKGSKLREEMVKAGIIEIASLGIISGNNLRRTVLIVDEAHKAKMQHLLISMTRVHHDGSKIILMGDERQHMSEGVSDFRELRLRFANPVYAGLVAQTAFSSEDIRRHALPKLMAERGDDVPPGLAKRLQEEAFSPEKVAGLLRAHFTASAEGSKDPLSDNLAKELIRRMEPHEIAALLEKQMAPKGPGSNLE